MAAWGETPRAIRSSRFNADPRIPPSNIKGSGIADPVTIVRQNLWPPGTDHWGLQQRIGWLNAVTAPYQNFYWTHDRLSQAQGLLYTMYAASTGGPS